MQYAIIDQKTGLVSAIEVYDDAWYAAAKAANNPKVAFIRPLVVDAQPQVSATQIAVLNRNMATFVVEPTRVRVTWTVRDKTAAELETESLQTEKARIEEIITDLQAQRNVDRTTWDAYSAAQLRAEQWRDRQVLLRLAMFLARRVRQGM